MSYMNSYANIAKVTENLVKMARKNAPMAKNSNDFERNSNNIQQEKRGNAILWQKMAKMRKKNVLILPQISNLHISISNLIILLSL